jgi:hypothetical protein
VQTPVIVRFSTVIHERLVARGGALGGTCWGALTVSQQDVVGAARPAAPPAVPQRAPHPHPHPLKTPRSGSPETLRDPRGFAVKFYTREGNYDMVGNNIPVGLNSKIDVGGF